jgi:general L-amino acid transport system substrate-binding protein
MTRSLLREPPTPATVNGHPGWADAVGQTMFGLMQAEERGITQANIEAKVAEAKANPNRADLHRFLGVEGEFGQQLGLPSDFVVKAVKGVGHYGEIVERNVAQEGGLIYAPPFR